jgi:hypothetical protein
MEPVFLMSKWSTGLTGQRSLVSYLSSTGQFMTDKPADRQNDAGFSSLVR